MIRRQTNDEDRAQRSALRRRLAGFYSAFNKEDWRGCFEYVDPRLRAESRVELGTYSASLGRFFESYGPVRRIYSKIDLYLHVTTNRHDDRAFAYVIVLWQDKHHIPHIFRERWVRDKDEWYTRVAGLVAHTRTAGEPS
jgi:hypothetical protein